MQQIKWNDNWKFWNEGDAFSMVWNIPEDAREITLPHDGMIEGDAYPDSLNVGNTGYRDGAVHNYVKLFTPPREYEDQTVLLKFEGVYMNAFVYVNGQLAGKRPYGYSQFYVSLNDYLRYGEENEIRVQVRNGAMTNSRWYSGSGIYRDVYLCVGDLCHIAADGVFVRTETVDEELATLLVETELVNRSHKKTPLTLETVICDKNGEAVAAERTAVTLFAGEERTEIQRIAVEHPTLWEEGQPELYVCRTRIYEAKERLAADNVGGTPMDENNTAFGIRTMTLDAKRGLRINGKEVKLRGACIHHDSGLIGAATYEDAQRRQIRKLKEAGFNAIRMSHNPMAPAMLAACDEIGMYVMDEGFDMWSRCKSNYDYAMNFEEWWERDLTEMLRKDRNHPSVILYSLGNEIPEIGTAYGANLCHRLAELVRRNDPTRYTLASVNAVFAAGDDMGQILQDVAKAVQEQGEALKGNVNNFMSMMDDYMDRIVQHPIISEKLENACGSTDIAGYNYMTDRFEPDGEAYPNRVIVGSETYPAEAARNWSLIRKHPHLIGEFSWTGWDYIGEAGIGVPAYAPGEGGFSAKFPCQLAYCGDFDLLGYRRPASYYRELVYGFRKDPYIAVQNPYKYGEHLIKTPWIISDANACWNYPGLEGKPAAVEVYAAGDEVELLKNGVSLGRKPAGEAAGFIAVFETTYESGTLTAVSYENGAEIGRAELTSAGTERKLKILEDLAGKELIYLPVEIQDGAGVLAADEQSEISISVEGDAVLAGFGSGNPKPDRNYNTASATAWFGRVMAILKRTGEGSVKVTVTSEKYGTAAVEIPKL